MLQASVARGKQALEAANLRKQQAVRQLRDEAAQKQLQYMWGAIDAEKYVPTKLPACSACTGCLHYYAFPIIRSK